MDCLKISGQPSTKAITQEAEALRRVSAAWRLRGSRAPPARPRRDACCRGRSPTRALRTWLEWTNGCDLLADRHPVRHDRVGRNHGIFPRISLVAATSIRLAACPSSLQLGHLHLAAHAPPGRCGSYLRRLRGGLHHRCAPLAMDGREAAPRSVGPLGCRRHVGGRRDHRLHASAVGLRSTKPRSRPLGFAHALGALFAFNRRAPIKKDGDTPDSEWSRRASPDGVQAERCVRRDEAAGRARRSSSRDLPRSVVAPIPLLRTRNKGELTPGGKDQTNYL